MQKGISSFKKKLFSEIISVPEILKPSHLQGLDGLRGVSIIIVILAHIFRFTKIGEYINGDIGVHIFFVISGFLITTIILKERLNTGSVNFKNFYLRRSLRIFPVAYLFILVLVFLNYFFHLEIKAKSIISAALYLKNIPSKNITDWYTGHFWTLSIEEQFYILVPIVLINNVNNYLKIAFVFIFSMLILEIIILSGVYTIPLNTLFYKAIFGLINIFGKGTSSILIGSLSSVFIFKGLINLKTIKVGYYSSITFFCLAICLFTISSDFFLNTFSPILFSIIISCIIVLNLTKNNCMVIILENRTLRFIGVLSYSLYIWQQLFTYDQPWKNSFKYSNSILLNIVALVFVACTSYFLYERPFLRLKDNFLPKKESLKRFNNVA